MKRPKVIKISDTLFEIPELKHSVKLQTKKGRTLLLCDCQNHTRFCNENPWCYHKQIVLEFIAREPIEVKLNELIKLYNSFEGIVDKIKVHIVLQDLYDLKRKFDL